MNPYEYAIYGTKSGLIASQIASDGAPSKTPLLEAIAAALDACPAGEGIEIKIYKDREPISAKSSGYEACEVMWSGPDEEDRMDDLIDGAYEVGYGEGTYTGRFPASRTNYSLPGGGCPACGPGTQSGPFCAAHRWHTN